jgi:hypothetical protein
VTRRSNLKPPALFRRGARPAERRQLGPGLAPQGLDRKTIVRRTRVAGLGIIIAVLATGLNAAIPTAVLGSALLAESSFE